ncbi:MAG TPA: hypothetical protein VIQ01_02105 [Burkholderiales bacterium]
MHISRFADAHRIDSHSYNKRSSEKAPSVSDLWSKVRPVFLTPASFANCMLEDVHSGLRASIASVQTEFAAARELVEQRYTARGYKSMSDAGRPYKETYAVTILATQSGHTVGTMTLRFDSIAGLNVDDAYGAEVSMVRDGGGVACELTCLAVAPEANSQATLAVLFRLAYFVADKLGVTDVFIEVNPRHERFYRRVLDFTVAAGERLCPRVQAPAVLLHQDMVKLGKRLGGFPPPTRYGARELAAA